MALNEKSLKLLDDAHPDLKKVAIRAEQLSPYRFIITETKRSSETQEANVKKGASKTMRSRHVGHVAYALDYAVEIDGRIVWKPWGLYEAVADAFKQAAKELRIPVEWGGDWRTFKDGCHIQLPWLDYPVE